MMKYYDTGIAIITGAVSETQLRIDRKGAVFRKVWDKG